ncbi:MAG TPA: helicase C-terminal domain-containing protein [Anaerohalosphaeraceae bacterium]|nr:helicase C-terminal domain-containing protein [Anaerohalosphaeraceae bacterium]HRT50477.1 helicase C-terminal domain-containing protein [Anaerohalosphaeraceae bacterium]HRT86407.1 helicase C-terminal domain-containing protein [Anaerohalosphaeraceae bacterium]
MISYKQEPGLNVDDALGPDGLIASARPDFESRPQQLQMAHAVKEALNAPHHLAVEAGTGVGKSFAYLIPAIDYVVRKQGKVLVSTYTITLQQQLINKDVPFLAASVGMPFSAELAKGRGNYLCRRRLEYAMRRKKSLFGEDAFELMQISEWAKKTEDGSLSDLDFLPSPAVWGAVKSEHGNCAGRKCKFFGDCFYWRARRALQTADIIIANHALLFNDLILKEETKGILPAYNRIIIDEAHNIEHVAEENFGLDISNFSITYLLRALYNPRTRKGALAYGETDHARDLVKACDAAAKVFFAQVRAWYDHAKDETFGRVHPGFVDDNISDPLRELRLELGRLAKKAEEEDDRLELMRYADRCGALEAGLKDFLAQEQEGSVYWVELSEGRRIRAALRSAPLDVSPHVKRCLFEPYECVITTSATLSCDGRDVKAGFAFFAERIGLETFEALKVGSPFDYVRQVTLYIEADLPDPNDADFMPRAVEAVKKYLLKTEGRAFVLFTSYSMLKDMAARLEDFLAEHRMQLLQQGGGLDRSVLLEEFKTNQRCVLFGTDSFWQGVDVPGEALSNVIIVRLPFAVPNHPLVQGRIELLRSQGKNPFFDYQLPTAIIKFKQGFGRLIRTKTDTGIVAVLDSRIATKHYGQQFLAAIPKCKVELISDRPVHDF